MVVAVKPAFGVLSFACLVAAALALAACGGASDDAAPSPTAAPEPAATEPEPAPEPVSPEPAADPPSPPAAEPTPAPAEPPVEPPPPEPEPPAEPPPPEPEPPVEPPPPPLPEGLPEDIAGYEDWVKLNAEPIPPIEGGDAHLGTKDVFASMEADRSGEGLSYPDGTIIVKSATRPDRDFVGLIAIMRKIAGSDPANNDWEFIEYARSEPSDAFSILASGSVCSSCHMDAAGTDYVWVHTTGDAP